MNRHSAEMEGGQVLVKNGSDRRPPLQRARYDPALESQGPNIATMEKTVQVSRQYF